MDRNILEEIAAERDRQDEKWGGPAHDDQHDPRVFCQLIEDYAGWARVMFGMGSPDKGRRRFIQISAMAAAAAESIDRQYDRHAPGQLALAAAAYAIEAEANLTDPEDAHAVGAPPECWPWGEQWWRRGGISSKPPHSSSLKSNESTVRREPGHQRSHPMSLSTCEKCGGHIPLGPTASNRCEDCGAGVFDFRHVPIGWVKCEDRHPTASGYYWVHPNPWRDERAFWWNNLDRIWQAPEGEAAPVFTHWQPINPPQA